MYVPIAVDTLNILWFLLGISGTLNAVSLFIAANNDLKRRSQNRGPSDLPPPRSDLQQSSATVDFGSGPVTGRYFLDENA